MASSRRVARIGRLPVQLRRGRSAALLERGVSRCGVRALREVEGRVGLSCARAKGTGQTAIPAAVGEQVPVEVDVVKKSYYKPDAFELWRGPSAINGDEIGVVVTHLRREPMNDKIGDMSQAWILPYLEQPIEAVRDGADQSVCGSCRFRPSLYGGCYVQVPSTAQRVWWAWRRFGNYQPGPTPRDTEALAQKSMRIGAWGDPAAVPLEVWRGLLPLLTGWTSYTHRWRLLDSVQWGFCMASVDSAAEALEAQALGWRTYRARAQGDALLPSEIGCPGADEAPRRRDGERVRCDDCGLCRGEMRLTSGRQAKSISIFVHGSARVKAGTAVTWAARSRFSVVKS